MNRLVREKLFELVRAGDTGLTRDASRVRAALADAVPGAGREIAALATAVEENVPASISRSAGSVSLQGSLDRLGHTLADNRALSLGAATWAVRTWAWVLRKGPPPDDSETAATARPSAMRAAPRQTLQSILQTYGVEVQRDPQLLRALLADLAPGFRREQAALVAAVQAGVTDRLTPGGPPPLSELADRLAREQALDPDAAAWAVAAWAWALGNGPEPQDAQAPAGPAQGGAAPGGAAPHPAPPGSRAPSAAPPSPSPPAPGDDPEQPTVPQRAGTPVPPPRPPGHPGGAGRAGHPGVGPVGHPGGAGPASHPGGAGPEGDRPPLTRPRRRSWPIVLGVLVLLAGGATAAVAAVNSGGDSDSGGYYPSGLYHTPTTYYTLPATTEPPPLPTTEPVTETTTESVTWAEYIAQTFQAPSGSCSELTVDDVPGVEYAMGCELYVDGAGNAVSEPVTVRYMGWASLSDLNAHLDEDAVLDGYVEDTWHFGENSSSPQGRLIKFFYPDGNAGIDWSYERKLLTGEAQTAGSADALEDWWTSATNE